MPMKIEVCKLCRKPSYPVIFSVDGKGDDMVFELRCENCGNVWEGYETTTVHTQAERDEAVKAVRIEGYLRGMLDSGIPDMDVDKRLRRYIEEIENG